MTARKVLNLFGAYLAPRIKAVRPRGYERPSETYSDQRYRAWLRVVCHEKYFDYEADLLACYVTHTADSWLEERCAEFEMALGTDLELLPFEENSREAQDASFALVPLSACAMALGVTSECVRKWTNKGLPCMKKGAYYWVNFLAARDWQETHGKKRVA